METRQLIALAAALLIGAKCASGQQCRPVWEVVGAYRGVLCFVVYDDGTGPALYAGGGFDVIGGAAANNIARWDGTTWSEVGGGLDFVGPGEASVYDLEVFDDGSGAALYVAGYFNRAGELPVNGIACWNGKQWSDVGGGVSDRPQGFAYVRAMQAMDGPDGPALYCGGLFGSAGGIPAQAIARWNGAWSSLGEVFLPGEEVGHLGFFHDGDRPLLMVGGLFEQAGGVHARGLAQWNGFEWSALGEGIDANGFAVAMSFAEFDDGRGPALFVGGDFATAGNLPGTRNIARWDGKEWSSVGGGCPGPVYVYDLQVFDRGDGPALYAGGNFDKIGGIKAEQIASWNGVVWEDLGTLDSPNAVAAIEPFGSDPFPMLWVGGGFLDLIGPDSPGIARYHCEPYSCLPDCDGNGVLDVNDWLCFTAMFTNGDDWADFDHYSGYGELDLFDFLAFINAFNAGC